MEKKQSELFWEILRRFRKAGVLKDVILIGSWTTVFYRQHFKGLKRLQGYNLITRDLDFLVDRPAQVKIPVNVPELLSDLGFVTSFVGSHGYIHLIHPDLIVEFLTPERARGVDAPVPIKKWGMNATALRFLNFLVKDTVTIKLEGGEVVLPHPARFALHKLVVAKRRKNKDKAQKDNAVAINILQDLLDDGEQVLVRSVYAEFSSSWQKKIVASLIEQDAVNLADVLKGEM